MSDEQNFGREAEEHRREWRRGYVRALIASTLSTEEVNRRMADNTLEDEQ